MGFLTLKPTLGPYAVASFSFRNQPLGRSTDFSDKEIQRVWFTLGIWQKYSVVFHSDMVNLHALQNDLKLKLK